MISTHSIAFSSIHGDDDAVQTTLEEEIQLRDAIKADSLNADAILSLASQRSQRFVDLIFNCRYYFDFGYTLPTIDKLLGVCPDLLMCEKILSRMLEIFNHDDQIPQLEFLLKQVSKELDIQDRIVFMTVRIAMTGEEKTPPNSHVAQILKIDRIHSRFNAVLDVLKNAH
jgi:hypothetical protein